MDQQLKIETLDISSNLVSLCHPCHSKEEILSKKIAIFPKQIRLQMVAIRQAQFQDAWFVFKGRDLENRTN